LKLNGTHQLLAYADDVNMLGGSAHAIKENVKALIVVSKETGLEVNADKTKYKVVSRDQNARRSQNVKTLNHPGRAPRKTPPEQASCILSNMGSFHII
jgi:UDP-N-acetylglucosamine enolpyruvyl transferase